MDIVADPLPDQVAMVLTGRPYLSYSAVQAYIACPLRWHFRYVMGRSTVPLSVTFAP